VTRSAEPLFRTSDLYERDFVAWSIEQSELLRSALDQRLNDVPGLDWANLAEEIEALGISRRRELRSRYTILLMHLLKWLYQPRHRTSSWRRTIREQRDQIEDLLQESPSLRPSRPEELLIAYKRARENAADETGFDVATFSEECPFFVDDVEKHDYLPGVTDP
jgi:hypothetical protein